MKKYAIQHISYDLSEENAQRIFKGFETNHCRKCYSSGLRNCIEIFIA